MRRCVLFTAVVCLASAVRGNATTANPCNVTGDNTTSVADIQFEINQALGVLPRDNDLNQDAAVNLVDVQIVIGSALNLGCGSGSGNGPAITDFNPKSGPFGTVVSVSGAKLGAATQVSLPQLGGGAVTMLPLAVSATAVSFVVPAGAVAGSIRIVTPDGTAVSAASFNVTPSSGFTLIATPASANLIQGQSVSFGLSIATASGFSQLARLSVAGLPAGVGASFQPSSVTTGQTSVLTLTAPANQSLGKSNFSISAAATVDGMTVTESAAASITVVAPTTSLMGRTVVADTLETPLAGVTVGTLGLDGNGNTTGCKGFSAISDGVGNFALTNLPASCTGPQLIGFNGTTATAPPGQYAGVNLVFTLTAGQVTVSTVLVHLPRIDNVETFNVVQNATSVQTHAFTSIPGLSVTVYANTTFTMPDGTRPDPFPLAAVQVAVDRLPDNKPNVPTMIRAFIVAFQPANATTNQPVAVYFPNTLNTPPGTDMALMTLDPTHGQMVPYGTGAVSADGTQIVPDPDPAHPGHRYGLVHFDWHGPMPPGDPGPDPAPDPCAPSAGDPVDLATGLDVLASTDIAIRGYRQPVRVVRTYRTLSSNPGPFGIGSGINYGYELGTSNYVQGQGLITLVAPNGTQYPFAVQPDGTLTNSTVPFLRGAVISSPSQFVYRLTEKNGTSLLFQPPSGGGALIAYLSSITDANGNVVTVAHGNISSPGQITQIVDPVGRTLSFTYDTSNRITRITDPEGRSVKYTYNSQGTLATVTDPAGGVTTYNYDSGNRLAQVIDARGVTVEQNTYDANGRVVQQTHADGGVTRFAYTLLNPMAPTSPVMTTTMTDQLGNISTYRFNPAGFVLSVTDPSGLVRVFTRDPSNRLIGLSGPGTGIGCGDPRRGDLSFSYDTNGNLLSWSDALADTTQYTADPTLNAYTSITDPLGNVSRMTYDGAGNLLTLSDPNGHAWSLTYSSQGQTTAWSDPLGNRSTFTYDSLGNPSVSVNPLGNSVVAGFDSISHPNLTQDSLGNQTRLAYDNLGRIVSQTNSQNQTVRLTYDAVGNVLSVTDQRGNATSFTYDSRNRVATRTSPLGKTETYSYDLNGNLIKLVDGRGQTSTFTYDLLNRQIGQQYQDGASVSFGYDANGRLAHVVDSASGTFEYRHDAAGRLIAAASPFGTVQYTYDADSRVTSRQVAGQPAVTYSYDAAGNLLSAAMGAVSAAFAYDARNAIVGIARPNSSTQYTYDARGSVLSVVHAGAAGILSSQSYSYDANGNRLSVTSSASPALAAQPLTGQYDAENQLTQYGPATLTYDGNGNLLSSTDSTGTTTYTWDGRNRLASILTPDGQKSTFLYDYRRNLISQTDTGPVLNQTQTFVLDDLQNVAYIGRSTGDSLSVLSGRSIDRHLAVIHANGLVEYGLPDALNSTLATVDQAGAPVSSFSYDPFGQTSTNSKYPFQFTGRVPVGQNLLYYRSRYYSTVQARYLQQDRMPFPSLVAALTGGTLGASGAEVNSYAYVGNNPASLTDPSGMDGGFWSWVAALVMRGAQLVTVPGGDTSGPPDPTYPTQQPAGGSGSDSAGGPGGAGDGPPGGSGGGSGGGPGGEPGVGSGGGPGVGAGVGAGAAEGPNGGVPILPPPNVECVPFIFIGHPCELTHTCTNAS